VREAVVARLAALAADDVDDLVRALDQCVAQAEQALASLLDREDLRARPTAALTSSRVETRTSPRSSPVAGAQLLMVVGAPLPFAPVEPLVVVSVCERAPMLRA